MRYPAVSSRIHAYTTCTYTHTHTQRERYRDRDHHSFPTNPSPPLSLWGLGAAQGRRLISLQVTSGSETAYSSQGPKREGRPFGQAGFLWGFPYKEPKAAAKATPILTHTPEVCVWCGGALPRRCPGAGTPCTKDCDSQPHKGTQGDRSPGARGLGEQGGGLRL